MAPGSKAALRSEEIEEVLTLIDDGKKDSEIEEKLGLSRYRLRQIRDENNRPRSKQWDHRFTDEQKTTVIDMIREGNTLAQISTKSGVSKRKIKEWREEEIGEGNALPEFIKGVSRSKQKYSDEDILELVFMNKGYGATKFRRTLGITAKLFIDICDTWKEVADQDLIEYLNHVEYFTIDEFRSEFGEEPTSYPIIKKVAKQDGLFVDKPVFPSPHEREFCWGEIERKAEPNPIIDWIIQRVNLNGFISRQRDLYDFAEQTGAGKTKFNKWMNEAGLTFDKNSGRWYLKD